MSIKNNKKKKSRPFFFDNLGKWNYNNMILFFVFACGVALFEQFQFLQEFNSSEMISGSAHDIKYIIHSFVLQYLNHYVDTYNDLIKYFNDDFTAKQEILFLTTLKIFYTPLFYVFFFFFVYFVINFFRKMRYNLSVTGLHNYKRDWLKKDFVIKIKRGEEVEQDYVNRCKKDVEKVFFDGDDIIISSLGKYSFCLEKRKEYTIFQKNYDDLSKKLKKDYLYFGQKKEDNKKLSDCYVKIDEFQRSAILGTSGGGKSNAINTLLHSIFFNSELYQDLYFIDFKGGIEAQPILKMSKKIQNGINVEIASNFETAASILVKLDEINKKRQIEIKERGLKKHWGKRYFVIIDEIGELLGGKPATKADKELQTKIKDIIESLFRTARSQKIYILYATQSFVGNASGISNAIKTNTTNRILFKTDEIIAIQSVFTIESIKTAKLNPTTLKIGESVARVGSEKLMGIKFPYSGDLDENFEYFLEKSYLKGLQKNKIIEKKEVIKNEDIKNCEHDIIDLDKVVEISKTKQTKIKDIKMKDDLKITDWKKVVKEKKDLEAEQSKKFNDLFDLAIENNFKDEFFEEAKRDGSFSNLETFVHSKICKKDTNVNSDKEPLEEHINKRKNIWKESLKLEDLDFKREIQDILKSIKKEQEEDGATCEKDLLEVEQLMRE